MQKIAATTKMTITTLRVPLVYGPSVRANFAALLRICDTFLPLPLDGITNNRRSLLFLGNLTHAIEAVISAAAAGGGTFLLSDGEDMSTAELVGHLRYSLNRHAPRLVIPASVLESMALLPVNRLRPRGFAAPCRSIRPHSGRPSAGYPRSPLPRGLRLQPPRIALPASASLPFPKI